MAGITGKRPTWCLFTERTAEISSQNPDSPPGVTLRAPQWSQYIACPPCLPEELGAFSYQSAE